ncbi:hypothetical protein [Nostocoides veronense]|uniref:Uncharacterized protein n=1 Tax=Nostocoides veronense TaxID=330836 RepID=A0ABN2LGM3_9MICO
MRRLATFMLVAAFGALAGGPAANARSLEEDTRAPAAPAYLSIVFGRSIWTASCSPKPGMRTLLQTAADLKALGLPAVGGVVVNRIGTTSRPCIRGVIYPTWSDLSTLRTSYGWSFVSQGMNYVEMTTLSTDEERYAESGATIPALAAQGHSQAWGLFNYPNDLQDAAAQAVVTRYFSFGRLYTETPQKNTRAAATTYPYPLLTYSLNGGRCNNPKLPCYSFPVRNDRRTTAMPDIVTVMRPRPGEYALVQIYRLVTGKSGTMGQANAWDCTSPDWRNRWTGHPENFCRNSFLTALRQRSSSAVLTTPAAVALAWGRGRPTP